VAEGVVLLGGELAQPAVDRTAGGVARLPDPDRLEMAENRVGVTDALHDGDSALVEELLHSHQVLVEAEIVAEGKGLGDRGCRQAGPEVVQLRVLEGNHRAEAVVATRQLDHDQDLVVADPVRLGGVDGAREGVGDGGVASR